MRLSLSFMATVKCLVTNQRRQIRSVARKQHGDLTSSCSKWNKLHETELGLFFVTAKMWNRRVSHPTSRPCFLALPAGMPSLNGSVEEAIQKGPAAMAGPLLQTISIAL
jgi:hypothetical protein